MVSKQREKLNKTYIYFLHRYMGGNRNSNLYLIIKVHKPKLKIRDIIDTKHNIIEPVSIWMDYQLQIVKHLHPKPIQFI